MSESPSDIKVGRILRVLEGPLSVTDEDDENSAANESSIRKCIRINVWEKMNSSLNELVDSVTLEDLAEDYRKRNGIDNTMYYI
ncbi:iron-sulfur cluster regulator IscR [Acetivibrio straminisolvens JCM 21531]|uniref:Iron-sulfur cluster regulator IscR n=1 Tax=Acetivibrio straminisolvens JCM 21531 TaxID=1294263 RepID=W4V620_9FIRM|nr:iron-sulfur cluster regulator IscR [Acetivibrio straminisolvens JCM 21531]